MVNKSHASKGNTVWISDEILSDTFHRFLHIQKRRGSCVPGPLEARRRATRRKNTNLAYTPGQSTPIDVGALFGSGNQQPWWNTSTTKREKAGEHNADVDGVPPIRLHWGSPHNVPLPSGLLGTPSPKALPIIGDEDPKHQTLPIFEPSHDAISDGDMDAQGFRDLISTAQTVDDVKSFIRSRPDPDIYRIAITHLLENNWWASSIDALLADQTQHCPLHKGHLQIIEHLSGRQDARCDHFLRIVDSGVALGRIAQDEMNAIFNTLPLIDLGATTPTGHHIRLVQRYSSLLKSVEDSPTLSVNAVEPVVMVNILRELSEIPFVREAANIAKTMLLAEPALSRSHLAIALRAWIDRAHRWPTPAKRDRSVAHLAAFLDSLVPKEMSSLVTNVSEKIFEAGIRTEAHQERLRMWTGVLRRLYLRERMFDDLIRNEELGECRKSTLTSKLRATFLRMWMTSVMSTANVRFTTSEQHLTALQKLLQQFEDLVPLKAELLRSLIAAADSLPVETSQLLNTLINLARKCNKLTSREDFIPTSRLVSDHRAFVSNYLASIQSDAVYSTHRDRFVDNLSFICSKINSDLPQFTYYARNLIMHDKASIKLITRLIRHNQPFKYALSASGSPKLNRDPSTTSLPRQCLETIEGLAAAFAISPILDPRQAYIKVHWCYLFLHRYGAPITPAVTRALYHAGVSRSKTKGVSPGQFEWIMKAVRAVEGAETARKLAVLGDGGYQEMVLRSIRQHHGRKVEDEFESWLKKGMRVPIEENSSVIRKFLV